MSTVVLDLGFTTLPFKKKAPSACAQNKLILYIRTSGKLQPLLYVVTVFYSKICSLKFEGVYIMCRLDNLLYNNWFQAQEKCHRERVRERERERERERKRERERRSERTLFEYYKMRSKMFTTP